jgi:hypothetical protein
LRALGPFKNDDGDSDDRRFGFDSGRGGGDEILAEAPLLLSEAPVGIKVDRVRGDSSGSGS